MFKPWTAPAGEVKADPFSLESLIAWLRTKDLNTRYDFCSTEKCLWAIYTKDHGGEYMIGGTDGRSKYVIGDHSLLVADSDALDNDWHYVEIAHSDPRPAKWTFGNALASALALQASRT